jgi:hypothetical protein
VTETLTSAQAADQAARIVGEIAREPDMPLEVETDPERSRETRTPGFSRMRTEWTPEDAGEVAGVKDMAEGVIQRLFPSAFLLLNELWAEVRQPVADPTTGELKTDRFGWPVWQTLPSGAPIEDYTRLTVAARERFLLGIATMGVEWAQVSNQAWLEAMLAKVRWEEAMAEGFTAPTGKLTVEERTQRGRAASTEHRYHAVVRAAISRAAADLVAQMNVLGQRIKDSMAL